MKDKKAMLIIKVEESEDGFDISSSFKGNVIVRMGMVKYARMQLFEMEEINRKEAADNSNKKKKDKDKMKDKILMYRWEGDKKWHEYKDNTPTMKVDDYKVGRIYTVEYKVVERDNK